jgi:hypothetical protein
MQGIVPFIVAGSVVFCIFILWLLYYRHICKRYIKEMDNKKKELTGIIEDAKDMIEELNRFSDYIVTQMDIKNQELLTNLKIYDEKLGDLNKKVNNSNFGSELIIGNINIDEEKFIEYKHTGKNTKDSNKKVLPINNKYKQVVEMSNKGMCNTEIARELNIGKGEIELILELGK